MATILIVNTRATLEADTIVAGAVEVGGCIEIVNLLLLDAGNGIVVHLRQHVGVSLSAPDACRGYEVGVDGKTLGEEELIAGTDDTAVVEIDIVDEEPRAYAVVLQGASFFQQLHVILIEQQARLIL